MSDERAYRKALAAYSSSSMSNTKWVKLFKAVIESPVDVDRALWRFIDSEQVMMERMPGEKDLLPERFRDGRFQPFEYKWIESIFIPKEFPRIEGVGYRVKQDTTSLAAHLRRVARFDIDEVEDGLWIYGYRR